MRRIDVGFAGKRKFKALVRGHELAADLPVENGGEDSAPTATETFIASLGMCVALFAMRYLETAGLDPRGLNVKVDWDFSEDKKRVGQISFAVNAPNAVLGARKNALRAAAGKCTLHNTLLHHPEIAITVEGE